MYWFLVVLSVADTILFLHFVRCYLIWEDKHTSENVIGVIFILLALSNALGIWYAINRMGGSGWAVTLYVLNSIALFVWWIGVKLSKNQSQGEKRLALLIITLMLCNLFAMIHHWRID